MTAGDRPVSCARCRHGYDQHADDALLAAMDQGLHCWQPMRDGFDCGCPGFAWVDPAGTAATDAQHAGARS